jgi:hypothetical protein
VIGTTVIIGKKTVVDTLGEGVSAPIPRGDCVNVELNWSSIQPKTVPKPASRPDSYQSVLEIHKRLFWPQEFAQLLSSQYVASPLD